MTARPAAKSSNKVNTFISPAKSSRVFEKITEPCPRILLQSPSMKSPRVEYTEESQDPLTFPEVTVGFKQVMYKRALKDFLGHTDSTDRNTDQPDGSTSEVNLDERDAIIKSKDKEIEKL